MKLKFFVIGLLLSFVVMMPGSAESAESIGHRLLAFEPNIDAAKTDPRWTTCGKYFEVLETPTGKLVYFTYERGLPGESAKGYYFGMTDRIVPFVSEKATTPLVVVWDFGQGTTFFIATNFKDLKDGLPCFGKKGPKI